MAIPKSRQSTQINQQELFQLIRYLKWYTKLLKKTNQELDRDKTIFAFIETADLFRRAFKKRNKNYAYEQPKKELTKNVIPFDVMYKVTIEPLYYSEINQWDQQLAKVFEGMSSLAYTKYQ